MAYAGEVKKDVKVTDYPAQNTFTVTMKRKNSGHFWCAIEIGSIWTLDDKACFQLSVTEGTAVLFKTEILYTHENVY